MIVGYGSRKPRRLLRLGRVAWPVALLVAIAAAVGTARADFVDDTYRKLRVFAQVLAYVQTAYVEDVDENDLIYDAITGMLSGLDAHTTFMRPEQYRKLKEDTRGEFGGLGISVDSVPAGVRIIDVTATSPAAEAGLKVGEIIVRVDDEELAGVLLHDATNMLRGIAGTRVRLRIKSGTTSSDVEIVRRPVIVNSVITEMVGRGVGYLRIDSFVERTNIDVGRGLQKIRSRVGGRIRGLIIDLRDNPGGLFDEAVRVADRFIGDGVIVRTEGRRPEDLEVQRAHRHGTEPGYPIAILINGGTASASEVFAGALQDHRRAKLMGTKSYGKGSVQTLYGLDDGSGLKLTVARYTTPSGRSIQAEGIKPDVVDELGATMAADEEPGSDPLVRRAVKLLRRR